MISTYQCVINSTGNKPNFMSYFHGKWCVIMLLCISLFYFVHCHELNWVLCFSKNVMCNVNDILMIKGAAFI